MHGRAAGFALAAAAIALGACASRPAAAPPVWSIALHGGAGVIERGQMDAATERDYRDSLSAALEDGAAILRQGGASLDAVETVIRRLEDDPKFNAGRGAVFTADGKNELDASIMDGASLAAGAVAGVTRTRHPISLARAVMEKSPQVMLIGEGAEAFARSQGLEEAAPGHFFVERRWRAFERELSRQNLPVPPRPPGAPPPGPSDRLSDADEPTKFGTVGVVALDQRGDLAAGTSTGGVTAKRWGRVGDSPIIGAGTYAQNGVCAVSATGTGEYFIRLGVARSICARIELRRESGQRAADHVVQDQLTALGGDGGVVGMDGQGRPFWSFNTPGMYRAAARAGEEPVVAIYKDER